MRNYSVEFAIGDDLWKVGAFWSSAMNRLIFKPFICTIDKITITGKGIKYHTYTEEKDLVKIMDTMYRNRKDADEQAALLNKKISDAKKILKKVC